MSLPPELLYMVFEMLPEVDLLTARCINRQCDEISRIPSLLFWNRMVTTTNLLDSSFSVSDVFLQCCRENMVLSFQKAVSVLASLRSPRVENSYQLLWESGLIESVKNNHYAMAKRLVRFGTPLYKSAVVIYVCRHRTSLKMLRLLLDNYEFPNCYLRDFILVAEESSWSEGIQLLNSHLASVTEDF